MRRKCFKKRLSKRLSKRLFKGLSKRIMVLALMLAMLGQWFLFSVEKAQATDGGGSCSVSPSVVAQNTTGNTFTFTYTADTTKDSGDMTIEVPTGWSEPQNTSASTAGYTTVTSTAGIVGTVESALDTTTNWATTSHMTLSVNTSDKQVGTGSLQNVITSYAAAGEKWYYNYGAASNWGDANSTNGSRVGMYIKSSVNTSAGQLQFEDDNTASLASPDDTLNIAALTANTWKYTSVTLGAARSAVLSYGFKYTTDIGAATVQADAISSLFDAADVTTNWAGGTANVTVEALGSGQEGTNAIRCTFAAGAGTNEKCRRSTTAAGPVLGPGTTVSFWIRSSVDTTASDLEWMDDGSAALASPEDTVALPALTANMWTYVTLTAAYSANKATKSYGINQVNDKGALTIDIDAMGKQIDAGDATTNWSTSYGTQQTLSTETTIKKEGTGSLKNTIAAGAVAGDKWYNNLGSTEDWSGYTTVGFWIYSTVATNAGNLQFEYDDTASLASPIATLDIGALTASTWSWQKLTLSGTRSTINSYGIKYTTDIGAASVYIDYMMLGPGVPTFSGTGPWTITTRFLSLTTDQTVDVVYGSGGGAGGVQSPNTAQSYTFTTQDRDAIDGTLTNLSGGSPAITTNAQPVLGTVSVTPSSVVAGQSVQFSSGTWTDNNSGETVKMFVCKTNALASQTTGGCTSGNTWYAGSSYTTTNPQTGDYVTVQADAATSPNSYYVFICDSKQVSNSCSASGSGTFTVLGSVSANFTINLWVRPTDSIASKALAVKNNEIRLVTDASGNPACAIHNGTAWQQAATSSMALPLNQWSYVSCVYDRSNIKIYINAVLTATQTMSNVDIYDTSNALNLGYDAGAGYSDFQGYIDEFKYYKYARSASQIKSDYIGVSTERGAGLRSVTVGEQQDASEGLVGYWKMDEVSWNGTAGEVIDSSGSGNNGASTNANTTSTAKFGRAGNFDGDGDYVTVSIVTANWTTAFTLSLWLNPSTSQSSNYVVRKSGFFALTPGSANYSFAVYIGGSLQSVQIPVANLPTTQWSHLVCAVNATTNGGDGIIRCYVNGSLIVSSPVCTGDLSVGIPVYIGSGGATGYFNGKIDDVKIYKKARSTEQIRRDYDSGPPPVAHWRLDENATTTAFDTSGNANNGALTGGPSWTQGKYGNALKFDGNNDYVAVGNINQTDVKTLSFWAKPETTTQKLAELSATDYVELSSGAVSVTGFGTETVYVDGVKTTTFPNTNWHYITVVSDTSITADTVNLGKISSTYFAGKLDDVRVYNYARTQKQIMEDMNAGHPAVGSPLGSYAGYWPLDEGGGTVAYDKSVNQNNGTMNGTSYWTTNGKFNSAFNGSGNDYVNINNSVSLQITDALTVSFWMKLNDTETRRFPVAKAYGASNADCEWWFDLSGPTSLKLDFELWNNSSAPVYVSAPKITDNNWHHIVGTYDKDAGANNLKIYVDGVLKDQDTQTGTIQTSANQPVTIGTIGSFIVYEFDLNGTVDELKIYPFALSPAEIKQEYNRAASLKLGSLGGVSLANSTSADAMLLAYCVPGDTTSCSAPVLEWKMNEKANTTAYDTAGAYNGTLLSGPTWKSAASCHTGSCVSFDGSNDSLRAADKTLDFSAKSFSISLWMYPTRLGNPSSNCGDKRATILAKGTAGNKGISLNQSGAEIVGQLYFYAEDAQGDPDITYLYTTLSDLNRWYHVEVVYDLDNTDAFLYVNGELKFTDSSTGDIATSSADYFYLSAPNIGYCTNPYFQGYLDDLRVYNYARTPAQVAYDYNRGAPIGWWKMNDGQDTATTCDSTGITVADASGNGNTGTLYVGASPATSTAWIEGKYSCGLDFDGTDDYVQTASLPISGTVPFTISAWVNYSSLSSNYAVPVWHGIDSATAGFGVGYRKPNSRVIYAGWGSATAEITGPTTADDTWYHVVSTYTGSKHYFYVNGMLVGSADYSSSNFTSGVAHFGNLTQSDPYWFHGLIDDVRMYNYALTATQVKQLYNEGAAVRFGPNEGLP